MKSLKNTIVSWKKHIYVGMLVVGAFVVGLVIPSPFFKRVLMPDAADVYYSGDDFVAFKDTTNMVMPDGSVYEGSLNALTNVPDGYGVLAKGKTKYEGNWVEGRLPFGTRTTPESVYEGRFDKDLDNNGFGIVRYTEEYMEGKRKQGLADSEIIATYVGNWKKNMKNGLGRSVMADSAMLFGLFEDGVFRKVEGAKYRVGDLVYGIDVSRHQADIDWNNLALYCADNGQVFRSRPKGDNGRKYMQPVFFAYMKATEGATLKDKTFDIRMIEAERHGIVRGAYHFLRLGSPIEEQVRNFVETVNWRPGDMPPALDVEVESEIQAHGVDVLLDMTYTWLEEVERQMHVRPIIYTRESIRDKYLSKDPRFANYRYWIARYHPDGPVKEEWQIWQMTETGRIGGYDGAIDIDLYKGDYKSFRQYLTAISRSF